ncbi:hypothetical protein QBC38DRAFT_485519 [Podospora fimiseda]|uniref:Exonuclease domain-containing protein n=1 Tax=Podospora fimiseda TaxID=252190 RepID=A0AAN7GXD9_9PEZI|nr:hypothetical protein QBC38DRAFT_485519 [Podospora fimiseda]
MRYWRGVANLRPSWGNPNAQRVAPITHEPPHSFLNRLTFKRTLSTTSNGHDILIEKFSTLLPLSSKGSKSAAIMDPMDQVLRAFKQIPCPQGDSCRQPGCQWQHSWETQQRPTIPSASSLSVTPAAPPTPVAPVAQVTPSAAPVIEHRQDEDAPRKRRKVELGEPESAPTQPEVPPAAVRASTMTKRVSPPPLKRSLPQTASSTPSSARAFHTSASKPSPPRKSGATPAHKKAASTPKATPQRKAETLNPRHLTTASPATHEFRLKALKALHTEYKRLNDELKKDDEKKLVMSDQELIWLALDNEQKLCIDKPMIYQNCIKNLIMSNKKKTPKQWLDERLVEWEKKKEPRQKESHLGLPTIIKTDLSFKQEVQFLKFLETPIKDLGKFGYVPVAPSDEEVKKAREGEQASLGWEVCDRCTTRFQVFPGRREEDGVLASGGSCLHHPGRTYFPNRVAGKSEKPAKRYSCCQESVGDSTGCTTKEHHVFKTSSPARLAALMPFVETPPNPEAPKNRAVAFDCEMGYTVYGLELIRVTATSWPDGATLLDVLVRPLGEIIDLNSRYSGVWPEDIANAEPWEKGKPPVVDDTETGEGVDGVNKPRKKMQIVPSPMAARDALFSLISPETPLIGHGLENDLNSIRIIHPTLVDTVLLFPTTSGLPMRMGLKKLMETKLNRAIQVEKTGEGVMGGHDSAEDARAAGELVRFKVMEKWKQMKLDGWTIREGGEVFEPPSDQQKKRKRAERGLTTEFLEKWGVVVEDDI